MLELTEKPAKFCKKLIQNSQLANLLTRFASFIADFVLLSNFLRYIGNKRTIFLKDIQNAE